ncbi:MAG: hypothetical protein WC614_01525 [bacterium]
MDPRNEGLTLEHFEKAINKEVPISNKVPEKICEMLELAKKICFYAYYEYDFYWLCNINLFLFTETAIKERFLDALPRECKLIKKEQSRTMIKDINIYKFLRERWRIVGYEDVDASLKSILKWLKKEKIIPKRIDNDRQLEAISNLRNSAAHLHGKSVYNFAMAIPILWVTIDFVNCLFDTECHDKEPECIKRQREDYERHMKEFEELDKTTE